MTKHHATHRHRHSIDCYTNELGMEVLYCVECGEEW